MRRLLIAAIAWIATFACFEIAYSLSGIFWSEEIYGLDWLSQLIVVLGMFAFWFAALVFGAAACWYTVPSRTSD